MWGRWRDGFADHEGERHEVTPAQSRQYQDQFKVPDSKPAGTYLRVYLTGSGGYRLAHASFIRVRKPKGKGWHFPFEEEA